MKNRWMLALSCLLLVGLTGCIKTLPPHLEKGMAFMRYMTSTRYLQRSMFYAAYPTGKPSEFIVFLNSDIGAAEWPESPKVAAIPGVPAATAGSDPYEEEQHLPTFPDDVVLSFNQPNPAKAQMQVVVKADDAAGQIILEAYESPGQPPVKIEKRDLPVLKPDPLAQASYQSLIEQGAYPGHH